MSVLISIISHGHGTLILDLLQDLEHYCLADLDQVIVTINTDEPVLFSEADFRFKLAIIRNRTPRGFASNHNTAFRMKPSEYFAALNPDLRLTRNPFPPLKSLLQDQKVGVAAPLILNVNNEIEDSARRLPTPLKIIKRHLPGGPGPRGDYPAGGSIFSPDWVAGIFLVLPSRVFAQLNGFDERYFLYFEDVDLCCRVRQAGYQILLDPGVSVVHNARRDSHRKIKYFGWHTLSAIRFFSSAVYRSERCPKNREGKRDRQ
jgi:hypothetical protein